MYIRKVMFYKQNNNKKNTGYCKYLHYLDNLLIVNVLLNS